MNGVKRIADSGWRMDRSHARLEIQTRAVSAAPGSHAARSTDVRFLPIRHPLSAIRFEN